MTRETGREPGNRTILGLIENNFFTILGGIAIAIVGYLTGTQTQSQENAALRAEVALLQRDMENLAKAAATAELNRTASEQAAHTLLQFGIERNRDDIAELKRLHGRD